MFSGDMRNIIQIPLLIWSNDTVTNFDQSLQKTEKKINSFQFLYRHNVLRSCMISLNHQGKKGQRRPRSAQPEQDLHYPLTESFDTEDYTGKHQRTWARLFKASLA